jgi:glycosyltransferase involved in cell wall biosynthesis
MHTRSRTRGTLARARAEINGQWRRAQRFVSGSGRQADPLPALRVTGIRRATPAIRVLCPDSDTPSGGVRTLYRYVDVLDDAGWDAAVLHHRSGFHCTWFANETRVVSVADPDLRPGDLLLVPEVYGAGIAAVPPELVTVSLNQNTYNTFLGAAGAGLVAASPYVDVPGLAGVIVVSVDNRDYLASMAPDLPVWIVPPSIDPAVFHPGGPQRAARRPVIGLMPRRRRRDASEVLSLLSAAGDLEGWEVRLIDGLTESQTADALRECAVFLSFSEREGFGLPPAEAMACGAYVVGFTGLAGREFFDPAYCSPVAEGDTPAFAAAVRRALARFRSDPDEMRARGELASQTILSRYGAQAQAAALIDAVQAAAGVVTEAR